MIQQGLTTSFKQDALQTLLTGDLKMALYTATADIGPTTTVYSTSNEVSGTGYVAGGNLVTGLVVSSDATTGTAYANFDNVSWPGASFVARAALIYNATQGDKAIAVLDFGSDVQFTALNNTVTMPANTATTALIRLP